MARRVGVAALLAAGTLIAGCGTSSHPQAAASYAATDPAGCPPASAALPAFTRAVGQQAVGRSVVTCSLHPVTARMLPLPRRLTRTVLDLYAVDGLHLPTRVNLDPKAPKGLQRITYCSGLEEGPLDVRIAGRWYSARNVSCFTNA